MIEIFHLTFGICLAINLIKNGEGLMILTKVITIVNSIRDKSPRFAGQKSKFITVEYKFGKRIYCIMVPIKETLPWVHVGAFYDGQWNEKSAKITRYAGPFRNFHSLPLRPQDLSEKYEKLAFRFRDGAVIHVERNEIIVSKLKNEYERLLREAQLQNTAI